jgi:hypothetical protein
LSDNDSDSDSVFQDLEQLLCRPTFGQAALAKKIDPDLADSQNWTYVLSTNPISVSVLWVVLHYPTTQGMSDELYELLQNTAGTFLLCYVTRNLLISRYDAALESDYLLRTVNARESQKPVLVPNNNPAPASTADDVASALPHLPRYRIPTKSGNSRRDWFCGMLEGSYSTPFRLADLATRNHV